MTFLEQGMGVGGWGCQIGFDRVFSFWGEMNLAEAQVAFISHLLCIVGDSVHP